jgi:integrase
VQDVLGHASPTTTQRYVQHRERLDHSAVYVLGTVLAGGIDS